MPNSRIYRIAGATLAALLVAAAGCTTLEQYVHNGLKVGPEYAPPGAHVAQQWLDADDPRVSSDTEWLENCGVLTPADFPAWWTVFNDPILNEVVAMADSQNISLREAGWRIERARAIRGITKGDFFPQVQEAFGSYRHIEQSQQNNRRPGSDSHFSEWDVGGRLAWELDFWGRYRRAILAADADLDASIAEYHDVLVLLRAEVASTYVEIRTLEQRLEYAAENVAIQQESVRRAQERFDASARDGELDLPQAKSSLARTEAEIPLLVIALRQAKNRLCVLLGTPPYDLSDLLGGPEPIPNAPPQVAVGIPADLLRRRPDVLRAERLLAAQSEEIGIALADLYPQITINGTIFLDARQFHDLFDQRAWAGSVGPSFRWNILNYGRIVNNAEAQHARFHELAEAYQRTVLEANEEAENALVAFLRTQQRVRSLEDSVEQAKTALERTTTKYEAGAADFNRVFNLQELLVRQQDQLAQSRGDIALNLIALYKALGGGWQSDHGAHILTISPAAATTEELPPGEVQFDQPGREG